MTWATIERVSSRFSHNRRKRERLAAPAVVLHGMSMAGGHINNRLSGAEVGGRRVS